MGMEFAAIEFVREKAPTVPVPTILEHMLMRRHIYHIH